MVGVAAPIVVALDPAEPDLAPLRFGQRVAGYTGAPLTVVAVVADPDAIDELVAAQLAEPLAGDATGLDGEVLEVAATSAPSGLELAAAQAGAALLVVGSAAHGEPGFVTRGRTADRLLGGATCSVAIVPLYWEPRDAATVVAGFVATEDGRAAVHGAHALATRSGARLRILAALHPHAGDVRVRAEEAAEASASGLLGAPVDIDVELADPATCLIEATATADLLVCGSRGYGPRPAALLGGVTRRVTAEARCPVIVLAREPDVPLDALLA